MKKPIHKLLLRSETLRALRTLDNRDLMYAAGGAEAPLRETGDICTCHAAVVTPAGGG
jgi:hypothetical protein